MRLAGFAKCAPAIRDRGQVEQLWGYLADGTLDCITSDHCGYTVESKERGQENIWLAPNGLSGVQTLLPVTVSEARARGYPWPQIAEPTASAPARLWHLEPRKGTIQVGADADLAFVDPERLWTLSKEELLHAHQWSPFVGRSCEAVSSERCSAGPPSMTMSILTGSRSNQGSATSSPLP